MGSVVKDGLRNIVRDKTFMMLRIVLLAVAAVAFIIFPLKGQMAYQSIKNSGHADSVLVMEKGNLKLAFSRIHEDIYQFVKSAPYVKKMDDEPLVSPHLQMTSIFYNKFIVLRGVEEVFFKQRGAEFELVEGRQLRDKYDILIGSLLPARTGRQFKIGDSILLENRDWNIVGIFKAKGDSVESGALVRMEDFKEATAREAYSYIEIKAESVKSIPQLTEYINRVFETIHSEFPDSTPIMALPEKEYWAKLAKVFKMSVLVNKAIAAVVFICSLLFLLNISHSSMRKRENGMQEMMRSGTGRGGLLSSVILEIVVLALFAGLIGGLIAMAFGGRPINLQLSTVILDVGGGAALRKGVITAVILGLLGGVPSIIQTLRVR